MRTGTIVLLCAAVAQLGCSSGSSDAADDDSTKGESGTSTDSEDGATSDTGGGDTSATGGVRGSGGGTGRRGLPTGGGADGPGVSVVVGDGACTNDEDAAILSDHNMMEDTMHCSIGCAGQGEVCAQNCMAERTDLSAECRSCWVLLGQCVVANCMQFCLSGDAGIECGDCTVEFGCSAEFTDCSGWSSGGPTGGGAPPNCYTAADCAGDVECVQGQCAGRAVGPDDSSAECGDVSYQGCCAVSTNTLKYCDGGLKQGKCPAGAVCTWDSASSYYTCIENGDGGGDPSGANPLNCP